MRKFVFVLVVLLFASGAYAFTANNFFTVLHENTADVVQGTAVFSLCNPLGAPFQVSANNLNFDFNEVKGKVKKHDAYFVEAQNGTKEIIGLDGKARNITLFSKKYENTKSKIKYAAPASCINLSLVASWPAAYAPDGHAVLIDWIPTLNLSGFDGLIRQGLWAWWNASWEFRQNITVSPSVSNLSGGYRLFLNLTNSSLSTYFNWSRFPLDLRFTVGDNISLPYYVQDFSNTTPKSIGVWVQTPLSSANTMIRVYYGNPTAANTSSYANFLLNATAMNSSRLNYELSRNSHMGFRPSASWDSWGGGVSSWTFYGKLNGSTINLIYDGGLTSGNCGGSNNCECHQSTDSGFQVVSCSFNSPTSCGGGCPGSLSFNSHSIIPADAALGTELNATVTGGDALPNYPLYFQNITYNILLLDTPIFSIQTPQNVTYTTKTIALNYTVSANASCGYELDGINQSLPGCVNTTINLTHGGHSLRMLDLSEGSAGGFVYFSADLLLYASALDESAGTPISNFSITLINATNTKTASNQQSYTGNFTEDPRGNLTLVFSATGYYPRQYYTAWNGLERLNFSAYLPATASSQLFLIFIRNSNGVAIEGAIVTVKRGVNGVLQTVGQAESDTSGMVAFQLYPNVMYSVSVTAQRYHSFAGTILPTTLSSSYQIFLTRESSTPNFQQVWNGIRYSYQPAFTLLKNTINTFNFTIYSVVDSLTNYGMNISVNGTIVSSQSGNASSGGSITATVDLSNYTTESGYARLWFTKSNMPMVVIQPDKNFNVYTNADSNISASSVFSVFGNSGGVSDQVKFMIAVLTSIVCMALTAGMQLGRGVSAIIGLLVFGMFVWIGWAPALYLTFGILFVFAITVIRGAY